jgi:hypothetical protein
VPSVLREGEKSVACEKATSSDGEAEESDARQCSLLVGGRACVVKAGSARGDGVGGEAHLKLCIVFFGGSEGVELISVLFGEVVRESAVRCAHCDISRLDVGHNLPPAKKVNGHDECGSAARAARVRDVGGLRVGPKTLLIHELSSCS